jgi:3-phenylpropionate/trans-cinnamate dioxygenase ferredoxin subunit
MLVEIGRTADVPEGEARRFEVGGREVAVVNLGDGEFVAIDDVCSHAEASLSEGEVDLEAGTIECPRHGSVFDLRTGKPRSLPATVPVATFPVRVEGDRLLIELSD